MVPRAKSFDQTLPIYTRLCLHTTPYVEQILPGNTVEIDPFLWPFVNWELILGSGERGSTSFPVKRCWMDAVVVQSVVPSLAAV